MSLYALIHVQQWAGDTRVIGLYRTRKEANEAMRGLKPRSGVLVVRKGDVAE